MSSRRFDALLIDFYGTLSSGDRDAVARSCRRVVAELDLPLTSEELAVRWGECFFALVDESNGPHFRTLYECELESLRRLLAEFGRQADPAPLVADLEAYWIDPPLHADAAAFLRGLEIPVCCVSNADAAPLARAIERHGLRFDAVVCSETVRSYKPDTVIFEAALKALGVAADRVMHVGDSLHSDIGGATKLGITSTWIRRGSRIHDVGTAQPDHIISVLTELPALLNGVGG